jgi:type IV pilus assembly protein PilC
MSIGSEFEVLSALPIPLRRRGFQLALGCLVAQVLLGAVVAWSNYCQGPMMNPVPIRSLALIPLLNLLMLVSFFSSFFYNWLRGRNEAQDQRLAMGQLAEMLRMGVPLIDALEGLSRHQAGNWRSRWSDTRRSLLRLLMDCQRGDNLGRAMSRDQDFPAHWAPLLEIAEEQGILLEVLENIELGRSDRPYFTTWFWIRLFSIWFLALPTALFLVTYILPTFVALFEGMSLELPLPTQFLIMLTRWFRSPLGALLQVILPLALIVGVVNAHLHPPFARWVSDRLAPLPPFRQVIPLQDQASLAMTLGCCLRLGLDFAPAVRVAALAVDHPAYRQVLLNSSGSLADIFEANPRLFSPPLRWLARQGERQGNLAAALSEAASYLTSLADETKLRWSVLLETGMTFLLGFFVTVLVLGTYIPIMQMVMNMLELSVMP